MHKDLRSVALEGVYPVLRFFSYDHLPPPLQEVSRPFAMLAWEMAHQLTPHEEVASGLRKLLEAKDCFVRVAALFPPGTGDDH